MQQNLKIVMRIKHHFKILLQKFSFTNYTYIYINFITCNKIQRY